MKRLISKVVAAVLVCMILAPGAQNALAEGDVRRGELLGYTCLGCHGIRGYRNAYPSYRVPKLGGQKPEALVNSLRAYRDEDREHHTMRAQAAVLSDQDIEDIVAWIAAQGPKAVDDVDEQAAESLEAVRACVACHGTQGKDVSPAPPVLSGQHASYLGQALLQYREGERGRNTVMTAFSAGLTDADIERLAAFYAAQDGLYTLGEKGQ
ncbi:MAG: c-type cytochrome [Woeseia sp.]